MSEGCDALADRGMLSDGGKLIRGGGGDIALQMSLLQEMFNYWMCKMRQTWKPIMCHIMKQQTE